MEIDSLEHVEHFVVVNEESLLANQLILLLLFLNGHAPSIHSIQIALSYQLELQIRLKLTQLIILKREIAVCVQCYFLLWKVKEESDLS